jgi:hypothetical protein
MKEDELKEIKVTVVWPDTWVDDEGYMNIVNYWIDDEGNKKVLDRQRFIMKYLNEHEGKVD